MSYNSSVSDAGLHYHNGASTSNDKSKIWLECYQYLKIYSIWGNETLGELKSDPDTYDHVTSLWNQLTVSNQHKNASNGQVDIYIFSYFVTGLLGFIIHLKAVFFALGGTH